MNYSVIQLENNVRILKSLVLRINNSKSVLRQELDQQLFRLAQLIIQLVTELEIIQNTGPNRTDPLINYQPSSPEI